jgi:hypothetical protein
MKGPPAVLVTKPSATYCRARESGPENICAINRTHSEMVKFGPEDPEYDKVLPRLQGLARRVQKRYNQSQSENTNGKSLDFFYCQ